ncbi:MAG: rod shape-determining protein RodA [Coriobacteriales bacterium]|jgi:rod shape determining protein RodA|nr:rod shape-determining protein RodA [Coriobacteriales bacterium]
MPTMRSRPVPPPSFTAPTPVRDAIKRFLSLVNVPLLIVLALLTAYGLLIVNSAVMDDDRFSFSRQVLGVGVGIVAMLVVWRVDYHRLSGLIVAFLVLDFILVLSPLIPFLGVTVNGARSWINIFGQQVQPGEPAKVLTIIAMAALVSKYRGRLDSGKDYLKCLGTIIALLMCILLQPDMGTGLVFFAIGMTIFFTGGVNWKWLALTILIIVVLIAVALYIDPILDERFGEDVFVKTYQKNRLLVFIDEDLDPTGAGHHLRQAKIAIGSGGMFGKGLYQSTQSSLGFLPEAPTDFIFCILAEELGFVGCIVLIAFYAMLIAVSFWVALKADDQFGTLLVMGCVGMWVFQILENIGMTCGLMPITGIPLPFMSYGSSFMLTNFMAVGLILSVWAHRSTRKAR